MINEERENWRAFNFNNNEYPARDSSFRNDDWG